MGVIWEIFSALTEGLGEAASVRISYFLLEGMPVEAKRLANKVAFLALVLVLGVTSIFLMAAPNIAFALSVDGRIQVLFIQLVGTAGLANVAMTFAQVYWSLAGAQGHFGLASAAILFCRWLIILPVASIFIYGFNFDLRAVACAVAIGYTIAAMFLAWGVFQRDWEQLAFSLREFDAMDYGMDGIAGFVDPIAEGLEGAADEDDDDDDAEDDDEEDTYDDDTDDDKESSDSSDPESAASLSSDTDNLEMIQVAGLSSPLDENRRNENNLV